MADLLIFDLDGTLSDSAPGILAALRHAFAVNGVPPLDAATELSLLGPPFHTSLPPLIGGESKLPGVLAAYRDSYGAGGMFDTTAYDGMLEVLVAARAAGRRMAVATSKPEPYAVPIVEHLGMANFFDTIAGDTLDGGRPTKAHVVAEVLARLGAEASETSGAVMIGDREHDVHGAREHGIGCVGAGWGYGQRGELVAAGADPICARPVDLLDALGLRASGDSDAATS